ncbi:MAG: SDR family oxidoreductase [Saprospiraceae bacterium]
MKKITLAYHEANQKQTDELLLSMTPIGVEFELIKIQETDAPGTLAKHLETIKGPTMLFFSSNFFKSMACMGNFLNAFQIAKGKPSLVQVLAPGTELTPDGKTQTVDTHIDRMADAIQYMNFWQNKYLQCIEENRSLNEQERQKDSDRMDMIQSIANEVGETLNVVRDSLYFSWEQIKAGGFKLFLQQFDMLELHAQVIQPKPQAPATPPEPVLPKEEKTLPPPPSGPVFFAPVEDKPEPPAPETPPPPPPPAPEEEQEGTYDEAEIQATIQDAWNWIENKQVERGIQVFQAAIDQYPEHQQLRTEYLLALSRHSRSPEMAEKQLEILHDSGLEEAKSYDLMGEIAQAKGDYLFAKYCWDRVLQHNPNQKSIYRKLALLTVQHLPDYQESAGEYLKAALQESPEDAQLQAYYQEIQKTPTVTEETTIQIQNEPEPQDEPEVEVPEEFPVDNIPAPPVQEIPAPIDTKPQEISTPPAPPDQEVKKLILITGASSGIGRACAHAFAKAGYRLILTGRRANRLDQIKQDLEIKYNAEIITRCFDVRDPEAVRKSLDSLPEGWQTPDILLNNAGLAKGLAPIHEGELDHWETMIDTNIKGLLYMTRFLSPGMVERRSGHIINVGSSAGKEVYPNGNVYCATKFAVDALSRAIRIDLHAHNIRVSQVSPGHVEETEFAITRFDGDENKARIYEDFKPLRASDVAETVLFIASQPAHVNIQDVYMFGTQQANSTTIDRTGRE